MSVLNFIPELWETQLLTNFRKNLVFGNVVNRDYEGTIRNAGDTVHITTPSAISVNAYSGTVNYETPASTQQALLIDQKRYWAFQLEDVDQAQANVSTMQAYMAEAAYALADDVDKHLASLYASAGTTESSAQKINLTSSPVSMYALAVKAGQNLDEKNVPRGGRWMVVSPAGYAAMLRDAAFVHATAVADQLIRTGEVGSISGFTVYVSNNLVDSSSGARTAVWFMYGSTAAITVADQLVKTEATRLENAFADGVRGLLLYGTKVVRPAALGAIKVDEVSAS